MPTGRPNILFCMRFPDDEGFVWKTVARLRDMVAGELAERHCYIAFPQLTGRSVHHFAHLQPVELDCYRLGQDDRQALAALVAKHQIGVIVYMSALPATLDLPFLRSLGLVTVNTEEDSYDHNQRDPHAKQLAKFVLRRVLRRQLHDLHIANSPSQGEWLARYAKIPPQRLIVVPNGIDCTHFVPAEPGQAPILDPARRWVICVSQARADKRVDLILRCAARIAAQPQFADVSFVCVGDGDQLEGWRSLAEALGIASRVLFAGQQDDLRPWYQSAFLMAHAAERESFGLVLAEAMACGLPVVASAAAGPQEIVAQGATGQLIPIDDEIGFGTAIERYLSEPKLARLHGAAGRERVCAQFSIHRQARDIAAAIRRVAG
ncbi:MAG: glycosyltransferase family 4 protein [Novosphingobium sp.]|nr:glycosyltransferase family 4 protein [Novosphingobium sp.]